MILKLKSYIVKQISLIDAPIAFFYLLLILVGLFIQLDITSANGHINYFLKQLIIIIISITACTLTYFFLNLDWLRSGFWIIYILTILLLVLVLEIGVVVNGAKRVFYVPLGFASLSVQPSLIARITLIILYARVLYSREKHIENSALLPFLQNFTPLIIFIIPVFLLILRERHFSALVISGATLLSMLFLANIKVTTIIILIVVLVLGGVFAINQKGAEYRKDRIKIFFENSLFIKFLKGEKVEEVTDYQTHHSLICLTSGKI